MIDAALLQAYYFFIQRLYLWQWLSIRKQNFLGMGIERKNYGLTSALLGPLMHGIQNSSMPQMHPIKGSHGYDGFNVRRQRVYTVMNLHFLLTQF